MFSYSTLTINDFTGGLTDNYKSGGTKFLKLDNFTIEEDKSAKLRDGIAVNAITQSNIVRSISKIGDITVAQVGDSIEYRGKGSYKEVTKTDPLAPLFPLIGPDDIAMSQRWRNSVLTNTEGSDDMIRTTHYSDGSIKSSRASLPKVTSATVVGGTTGDNRLFAVAIVRTYTDIDGFTYREYSPEFLGSFQAESGENITVSDIQPLIPSDVFADETDYAIFITKQAGTTFYLASTSPTIPFTFSIIDSELEAREVGFFLSEEPKVSIPKCRYFKIINNTGYYLNIYNDNGTEEPYRLYQSATGMPTSVIASGYTDFDYNCNGIGEASGYPIVLTDDKVYRVDGVLGVDGSGSLRKVKVYGSEGGISHNSIVNANDMMYYAGTDGFYATDGFKARNISGPDLYETYANLIRNKDTWKYITGTFDRDNNIIYWRVGDTQLFLLHLDSNGFTTHSYGSLGTNMDIRSIYSDFKSDDDITLNVISETSRVGSTITLEVDDIRNVLIDYDYSLESPDGNIYNGTVIDILEDGDPTPTSKQSIVIELDTVPLLPPALSNSLLYESSNDYSRQLMIGLAGGVIVTSKDTINDDIIPIDGEQNEFSTWETEAIDYDILTAGINYGNSAVKKWTKSLSVSVKSNARFALQPYTIVENNDIEGQIAVVSNKEQFTPFDVDDIYGRKSLKWFPKLIKSAQRHFPRRFCRSRFNQVGLRSVATDVFTSEDYARLTVTDVQSTTVDLVIEDKRVPISYNAKETGRVLGSGNATVQYEIEPWENNIKGQDGDIVYALVNDEWYKAELSFPSGDPFHPSIINATVLIFREPIGIFSDYDGIPPESDNVRIAYDAPITLPYSLAGTGIRVKSIGSTQFPANPVRILSQTDDRQQITISKPNEISISVGESLDWIIYAKPKKQSIEIMSIDILYAPIADTGTGFKQSESAESYYD